MDKTLEEVKKDGTPFDYKTYIKKYFAYDSMSGIITRIDRKNGLGSLDKDGYLILKIKGKQFKAHRIAWLLYYGDFPKGELDHIDRNRTNNRISNLRVADRNLQVENRFYTPNKDTNEVHIYLDKNTDGLLAKYTVTKGKRIFRFRTLEEARKKRDELWKVSN